MRIHFFADRLINEKHPPSRKAIYRFFRDSGVGGVDLVLLGLADVRATRAHALTIEIWNVYLDVARTLLENYWERPEEIVAPPRLLDGHELMKELSLKPGPVVGQILEIIREEQAAGQVNSREDAIACAREWIKENPVL